jgi:hypothetical protein
MYERVWLRSLCKEATFVQIQLVFSFTLAMGNLPTIPIDTEGGDPTLAMWDLPQMGTETYDSNVWTLERNQWSIQDDTLFVITIRVAQGPLVPGPTIRTNFLEDLANVWMVPSGVDGDMLSVKARVEKVSLNFLVSPFSDTQPLDKMLSQFHVFVRQHILTPFIRETLVATKIVAFASGIVTDVEGNSTYEELSSEYSRMMAMLFLRILIEGGASQLRKIGLTNVGSLTNGSARSSNAMVMEGTSLFPRLSQKNLVEFVMVELLPVLTELRLTNMRGTFLMGLLIWLEDASNKDVQFLYLSKFNVSGVIKNRNGQLLANILRDLYKAIDNKKRTPGVTVAFRTIPHTFENDHV